MTRRIEQSLQQLRDHAREATANSMNVDQTCTKEASFRRGNSYLTVITLGRPLVLLILVTLVW